MKKVLIGFTVVAALAVGFVGGQHSVNNASGEVQVASIGHGA
ncbi:lysogeny pheromone AimP family peptide [Bacillus amyloliquefaciens]|nr:MULTISPECIES: lysogeny pheromone AimP family peptide [Bacillus amyloliquefaciens group]MDE5156313.1 lysogeny pheromone AimP family peptide [Bacillus amyloliquefaciens]MDK2561078.1 lysogeny pheromone AimP family peptide [Bacillus amyloliquefaciens]QRL09372.1 lysogeny pheromone AimP family peptide [Bacillus velezensis]WPB69624.1 lysogeny pheromone AimP family peptide [Bacillus velezensis]